MKLCRNGGVLKAVNSDRPTTLIEDYQIYGLWRGRNEQNGHDVYGSTSH